MDLRNRLYPYPVLSRYNDDYIEGDFDIDISYKTNRKEILFDFNTNLANDYLRKLIDAEYAEYAVHIECSQTCFRKLVSFSETKKTHIISCNEINDTIHLYPYILAKNDIIGYSNPKFNDIYDGLLFDIARCNIMAIGTPVRITIEKDYDPLKNVKSIFIIISDDRQSESVLCDISKDLIEIYVPRQQFAVYKKIGVIPYNIPIIHSVLVIPILVKIFEIFKNNESAWEDFEDRKWFRAIKRAFEKKEISFTQETIHNFDSYQQAQLIIESPILRVFDNMKSMYGSDPDLEDLL